jgi:hypothetical protein
MLSLDLSFAMPPGWVRTEVAGVEIRVVFAENRGIFDRASRFAPPAAEARRLADSLERRM